ncbi:hypothetical protein ACFQY5_28165 [Paeniroseomonas aquatica]
MDLPPGLNVTLRPPPAPLSRAFPASASWSSSSSWRSPRPIPRS